MANAMRRVLSTLLKEDGRRRRPVSGRDRERGVSLLEVMVVLVIIGLVAAIAAPQVIGYLDRSKVDAARIQVRNLSSVVDLFRMDMGRFPTEEEGLAALVSAPVGAETWRGPYLKSEASLIDPWGRPYRYAPGSNGSFGSVISYGADGEEGGTGLDADIVE